MGRLLGNYKEGSYIVLVIYLILAEKGYPC